MIDFDDLDEELDQKGTDLEALAVQNRYDKEEEDKAKAAEEALAKSVRIHAGLRVQNTMTGRTGEVIAAMDGTPANFRIRFDNSDERVFPVAKFETEDGRPLLEVTQEEAGRLRVEAEEADRAAAPLREARAREEAERRAREEAERKAKQEAERQAKAEAEKARAAARAAAAAKGGGDLERFIDYRYTEETAFKPMPDDVWWDYPRAGLGERPQNMKQFKELVVRNDPGEFWKIPYPRTPEQLKEWGPEWLTKAMHTAGTLPKDNAVVKFRKFQVKAGDVTKEGTADENMWGGAGCKVLMAVEYKNGPGDLTEGMFIKMPFEFTGKNERYKNSITLMSMDWSEVMFLNLLAGKIPVRTPRCYFADMNRTTTNSIIIMETIPYAEQGTKDADPGEFFAACGKYRDWDITNAVDLYYSHAKGLAQFCAWYKSISAVTDQIDLCFMDEGSFRFRQGLYSHVGSMSWADRDANFTGLLQDPNLAAFVMGSGFPPNVATGFVQLGQDFVTKVAPQYFPADLVEKKFRDKVFKEVNEMAHYIMEIGFYSSMMPEYFSLAHPNAQIDNAFFWRDHSGEIMAGLTDFGSMSHVQMPNMLQGGWCGAEPEHMDEHEEKLTRCFLDEYEKAGGGKLDFETFFNTLKINQAMTFCGCCANLGGVYRIMPKAEWKNIKSRFEPKIDNTFLLRCYTVQIIFLLALWRKRSPYPHFQKWMQKTGLPKKEISGWGP